MNTNTNTNNNTKENKNMNKNIANITKNVPARKTRVEIIAETNKQGVSMEYLAIDGKKIGVVGYANQKDREAAMAFVQKIVDNSTNNGMALYAEIMDAAITGAAMTESGIQAKDSEEVNVDGASFIINYVERKIYAPGPNLTMKAIANLDDLTCELPNEAIKALLVERAKVKVANNKKATGGCKGGMIYHC